MRTHGWVMPHGQAAGDLWWLGLRIGDLDEVTGAATNNALVPNPRDNPGIDWMLDVRMDTDATGFVGPLSHSSWVGQPFDLKSKRRMHQVQQVYELVVYQEAVTTVAKNYDWFARTLLALP